MGALALVSFPPGPTQVPGVLIPQIDDLYTITPGTRVGPVPGVFVNINFLGVLKNYASLFATKT